MPPQIFQSCFQERYDLKYRSDLPTPSYPLSHEASQGAYSLHDRTPAKPPRASPLFLFLQPLLLTYFWAVTNHTCFLKHAALRRAHVIGLASLCSTLLSTPIFFPFQALFNSLHEGNPPQDKSNILLFLGQILSLFSPLMYDNVIITGLYVCNHVLGSPLLEGVKLYLFIFVSSESGHLVKFELWNYFRTLGKLVLDWD